MTSMTFTAVQPQPSPNAITLSDKTAVVLFSIFSSCSSSLFFSLSVGAGKKHNTNVSFSPFYHRISGFSTSTVFISFPNPEILSLSLTWVTSSYAAVCFTTIYKTSVLFFQFSHFEFSIFHSATFVFIFLTFTLLISKLANVPV